MAPKTFCNDLKDVEKNNFYLIPLVGAKNSKCNYDRLFSFAINDLIEQFLCQNAKKSLKGSQSPI